MKDQGNFDILSIKPKNKEMSEVRIRDKEFGVEYTVETHNSFSALQVQISYKRLDLQSEKNRKEIESEFRSLVGASF